MDCHVFRRLCQELAPLLLGGRVEKIHQPASDLTMFSLYAANRKHYLFLRADRGDPFLFRSSKKVAVGTEPPAFTMRLRKYFSGQRLMDVRILWPERRLLLRARGEDEQGAWLELDLREGCKLHVGPAGEPFAVMDVEPEAAWPEPEALAALCSGGDGWRQWPVLSPALRRTLTLLDDDGERAALVCDLMAGGGDLFVYGLEEAEADAASAVNCDVSAWPLPDRLRAGRSETVFESALEAVDRVGAVRVLRHLTLRQGKQAAKPHVSEADRLQRLLRKLADERVRLESLASLKTDAVALQAELYRFGSEEKLSEVALEDGVRSLRLDPRLTVRENMATLFHRAGRGARGLVHLEERLARVTRDRELALAKAAQSELMSAPTGGSRGTGGSTGKSGKDGRDKGPGLLPKNVQAFRSSDGFLLLRGRDAKGNLALLKLASPHDLWLHVGSGAAGAHVIIRRHHVGQEFPERTLQEAGGLAALKSERRGDANVEIAGALVKYVRPMKQSGRVGTVRMDRIEATWTVNPDPELEGRLGLDF